MQLPMPLPHIILYRMSIIMDIHKLSLSPRMGMERIIMGLLAMHAGGLNVGEWPLSFLCLACISELRRIARLMAPGSHAEC